MANCWSVVGLLLDIAGVLGVGFIPSWWGIAIFGGGFELPRVPRLLYRLSWIAIIVGFALQMVGQFRPSAPACGPGL
jgi:hypothetical protein